MSNIVLSAKNRIDAAGATFYGNEDAALPLTNLRDPIFSKVWRYTPGTNADGNTAKFQFVLTPVARAGHVAFARHNMGEGAQVRVRAGTARLADHAQAGCGQELWHVSRGEAVTALVRYEQARTALAECHRVDEVKDIRDKAEAMAAYARQAKDTELIQYATEIKVRAERRAGEMTASMETAQGRRTSSDDAKKSKAEQLADVGLTVQEAHRYEALAAMPAEHFETAVATAKATAGEVTTAFLIKTMTDQD